MGRPSRWLTLASFLLPALAVVYAAVTGHDAAAMASAVWLLATDGLLVGLERRR
jgi:hypothetical protein